MKEHATILDRARKCMILFETLHAAINEKNVTADLASSVDDQIGRFNIWSGNIGLYASASASLDYRVQDIPQIKNLIIQQLDGLEKDISRGM